MTGLASISVDLDGLGHYAAHPRARPGRWSPRRRAGWCTGSRCRASPSCWRAVGWPGNALRHRRRGGRARHGAPSRRRSAAGTSSAATATRTTTRCPAAAPADIDRDLARAEAVSPGPRSAAAARVPRARLHPLAGAAPGARRPRVRLRREHLPGRAVLGGQGADAGLAPAPGAALGGHPRPAAGPARAAAPLPPGSGAPRAARRRPRCWSCRCR